MAAAALDAAVTAVLVSNEIIPHTKTLPRVLDKASLKLIALSGWGPGKTI